MRNTNQFPAITLTATMLMLLAGCGGGGGGGGGTAASTASGFSELPSASAGYASGAAAKAAAARPRAGSITQSSNTINDITQDQVQVSVQYGATGNSYSVHNGSTWSISTADGNPFTINALPPFRGQELEKRVNGGRLYVDVYSDIQAPVTQQANGSDNNIQDVPLGTRIFTGNVSGSPGGASLPGNLNGEPGTFACTGGCTYSGGLATGGTWTFTPDRPIGAINISGVSGVTFTGAFNPSARTPGTYNGQAGYFRCLSLDCGGSSTNGQVTSLTGQWVFVPATGGNTVSTPDTDYLAGGVWLFVPDDATSVDDVVFGAFVDGNDPFRQNNLMALQGTARYNGLATGLYASSDGENSELGYLGARVGLTADFGGQSNLGTISGSITDILTDGNALSGSLALGTANIGSSNSGFFEGRLSGTVDSTSYTGRWGGQFFGNGEADGKPGSVGGTLGGTSGSGDTSFVGTFGAYKQ